MLRKMPRVLTLTLVLLILAGCAEPEAATPATPAAAGYVESAQCESCHQEIADTYRKTGMGRSFSKPTPQNTVENYRTANTFYHAASGRYYTMIERDGRYFQRRHQMGPGNQPINIVEESVDYVIGSGNHVRTYLHLTEQKKLVELPIAWYAEKGGYWGMNPGYDWARHSDFRRKLTTECMFCHDAYPESKKDSDRADMEAILPAKIPEGIDCQRCHGPGAAHVQAPTAQNIVNPSRLPAARNLEVCLQCHLETTSTPLPYAVRRPGRGVFSFKPGEPLADYAVYFDHAEGSGHDDKFEIAGSAYRLMKSRCFLESAGAMTCTTCHNPHDIPRGEAAATHYTAVCQKCHAAPIPNHTNSTDCVGCHMPKRRTDDVVHAVMTDHFIQRKKPARDLLAEGKERHGSDEVFYRGEVALYYPRTLPATAENELIQAMAQVTAGSNLPKGVPRLKAAIEKYQPTDGFPYFELAKVLPDPQAIPFYEAALQRVPDFWPAQHRLGLALSRSGQLDRALGFLLQASSRATEGTVLNDLGLLYRQMGKKAEALGAMKKSVARDPGLPHVYNNLAGMLIDSGDAKGAEDAFREAIRVQPDLAQAHFGLGSVLVMRGEKVEALMHFEISAASPDPRVREPSLQAIRSLKNK